MAADPTSVLFEAVRAYLAAVHPRFPIERIKLIGRDKNKIDLRVTFDLTPPAAPPGPVRREGTH